MSVQNACCQVLSTAVRTTTVAPVEYPSLNAIKVGLPEFQLVNYMEEHERSAGSPESESCQGRQLVVIRPWEGNLPSVECILVTGRLQECLRGCGV